MSDGKKGNGHDSASERAVRYERAVLGVLLEAPEKWLEIGDLTAEDFLTGNHREIFQAIAKLHTRNCNADIGMVSAELPDTVDAAFLSSLVDAGSVHTSFRFYVRGVREAAELRRFWRVHEQLNSATNREERLSVVLELAEILQAPAADQETVHTYAEVGEVATMQLDYVEPIISGLLGRGTVNLLSGDPGIGKSFLALRLGVSCALGSEFLGRTCRKTKVLMLDRENPLALVQKRLHLIAGGPVPGLRVWGGWLTDPPAPIGDPRLLQMSRAEGSLLFVFDSFVRFHSADENSASEMRDVMAQVRRLADAGSTVLLLHHRPKSQETMYRGSSDILAGADVAFSVEKDSDGLKLVGYKSRDSELTNIGIQVDFAKGKFLATDTQAVVERRDTVELLADIIRQKPGASQVRIAEQSGLRRVDVLRLLRSKDGSAWQSKDGPRHSRLYYPLNHPQAVENNPVDLFPRPVPEKTTECIAEQVQEPIPPLSSQTARNCSGIDSHCTEQVGTVPEVSCFPTPPRGGKREQVAVKNTKPEVN